MIESTVPKVPKLRKAYRLLPCPFCGNFGSLSQGGNAHSIHVKTFAGLTCRLITVECGKCGACGPPHIDFDDEDTVEQRWNQRPGN